MRLTLENERSTSALPDAAKVRKAAAFNLSLLGEDLAPKEACATLAPAQGCEKPAHVCVAGYRAHDRDSEVSGRFAVLAADPARALSSSEASREALSECSNGDDPFRCTAAQLSAMGTLELVATGHDPRTDETNPLRRCRLLFANACEGVLLAACSNEGQGRKKEIVVERRF